jgi:transcriptional regulator with XRE-family HTH domain
VVTAPQSLSLRILEELLEKLPDLIRLQRLRKGQSLREAANTSGVSFNTLSRWERGKAPIADVLKVLRWLQT